MDSRATCSRSERSRLAKPKGLGKPATGRVCDLVSIHTDRAEPPNSVNGPSPSPLRIFPETTEICSGKSRASLNSQEDIQMKAPTAIATTLSLVLLLSALCCAQYYTVQSLASYSTIPHAINNHGHVAGGGYLPSNPHYITGFWWSPKTGVRSLSLASLPGGPLCFPGSCSQATMLNDKDAMTAVTAQGTNGNNCFVWPKPPSVHWLPAGIYQFYGPATCTGLNNKAYVLATGEGGAITNWMPG